MVEIIEGDCVQHLRVLAESGRRVHLTFLDPPFNQGKEYDLFDDNLPDEVYWGWMREVCALVYACTHEGGAIYFMQREKNTEQVLRTLRETGWSLQNLIIWLKRTSAVPNSNRFGKQYQIIAFATKGQSPRVFHRLRVDAPLRPEHKQPRQNGVFVTDVWDDIRELTSGYFAGDEALRNPTGERVHLQQSPIALLLRIILSSSDVGDWVLDPFAGTGTTGVVAEQLQRNSILIEIAPSNVEVIRRRLETQREADSIERWRRYYRFTPDLESIWPAQSEIQWGAVHQMVLFEAREDDGYH